MRLYSAFFFTLSLFAVSLLFIRCNTSYDDIHYPGRQPVIDPDYTEVTAPPNIAPLNFTIKENGDNFRIVVASSDGSRLTVNSRDGHVRFPLKSWKNFLSGSGGEEISVTISAYDKELKSLNEFEPFSIYIAGEKIDPSLVYRLIHPGYHGWNKMDVVQRSLECFGEEVVVSNNLLEDNCINCHAFNQNDPERFMIHVRGSKGGTYFIENDLITRTSLKTEGMPADATYPSWHPSGRFIAFSSNDIVQSFNAHPSKVIDVFDVKSSLVLYDAERNEMIRIEDPDSEYLMHTFPSWSHDGKYLYFSSTRQDDQSSLENIQNTNYDLVRKIFDPDSRTFGEIELVFNASGMNKSASFARPSPDGKYMVFTLHDYGTFPIWYQEADLYVLDLENKTHRRLEINSNYTESYHSWSSEGKWLVFSSKRGDGLTARPYFAYFNSSGVTGKPFILPQRDPDLYGRLLRSYNIPELVKGRISVGPRDFARAAKNDPARPESKTH